MLKDCAMNWVQYLIRLVLNNTKELYVKLCRLFFLDAAWKPMFYWHSPGGIYNAGKTRNAASAKGNINGESIDLECISGRFSHK